MPYQKGLPHFATSFRLRGKFLQRAGSRTFLTLLALQSRCHEVGQTANRALKEEAFMPNQPTNGTDKSSWQNNVQMRIGTTVGLWGRNTVTFFIACSAATMVYAEPASAQEAGPYITADVGIAFPEDEIVIEGPTADAGGTPGTDIDDNLIAGIGAGYDFANGFRLELESRFTEFDSVDSPIAGINAGGLDRTADSFAFNASSDVITLMANAYYDFDLGLPFKPYVKGGAGLAFTSTDAFLDTTINSGVNGIAAGTVISDQAFGTNKETDFTWSLGAGVSYPLTDSVSLDMEYQYQDYGSVRTAFDETGDAVRYSDIASHSLLTGLRIKF